MRSELRKLLILNSVNPTTSVLTCEWDEDVEMFAICRPSGEFVAHIYESEKHYFKRLAK